MKKYKVYQYTNGRFVLIKSEHYFEHFSARFQPYTHFYLDGKASFDSLDELIKRMHECRANGMEGNDWFGIRIQALKLEPIAEFDTLGQVKHMKETHPELFI